MADQPEVSEFIRLLTSHELRLRAFALSLVPHWADADEITQQANLVMWQKFNQFTPGTSFFSWAARIVHLTAKDFRKRQRREAVRFSEKFLEIVANATIAQTDELSDREQILSECLKKLKPKQRQLISLNYEQGSSAAQMAAVLHTSTHAVRKALTRVRRALYECVNRGMRREDLA